MTYRNRTEVEIAEAIEDGRTLSIDRWYDRSIRSYRTMVVDETGAQIGDANYDGTRADREASVRELEAKIAEALVTIR